MANPTFLFMNPGSVVYTGSGAGFSNLNDYDTVATWSSGVTTNGQYIQVDLGSARNVSHLAMQGVVIPYLPDVYDAAQISVSGSNSSGFSPNTVLSSNIYTYLRNASGSGSIVPMTTTGSFRYVRVQVHELVGSTITIPFQLSALWAGNALVMDSPFDVPARTENAEYQTFEGTALNGNLRSTSIYSGGRLVNEVRFSIQSDTTANNIRSFVQSVKGRRFPFYFSEDTPTTHARLMHFTDDYVPIETVGYNLNSVAMKMRTHTSEF